MKILNGSQFNRVKIQSNFLEDPRLSFSAKGLLGYLLTNKLDDFNTSDLYKASRNGRDSTRKVISELIHYGYIRREKLQNSEGKFCGIKHHIYPNGRECEI